MARIKRGVTTRAKHKRILEQAKGYYGRRKNTIRIARQAVEKAGQYAYRDRKVKKRSFRALWIQRINAAVRAEGLTYGRFMHGLKLAGVDLDRKVLADIAMHEGEAFKAIIAQAKGALPGRRPEPLHCDRNQEGRGGDSSPRPFSCRPQCSDLGRRSNSAVRRAAGAGAIGEPDPFVARLALVLERADHRLGARDRARKSGSCIFAADDPVAAWS